MERRRPSLIWLLLAVEFLAGALLTGCAEDSSYRAPIAAYHGGRTHFVERGETLYHIAQENGVSISRLMAANHITDARQLYPGQVLFIPGASYSTASLGIHDFAEIPHASRQFAWPIVAGVVSSPFGIRHGVMHDGVDIAAPSGTPVEAADSGRVLFVGRLHGYGNVVILQHSGDYVTIYGHNRRNLVHEGEFVARGQQIAELGSTGRASGPNLHFEVRYANRPQNPLAYLPEPASGISFARNTTD